MAAGADDDDVVFGSCGSGEPHCSGQPLWPRIASRARANTEYFRMSA